MLQDTLLVSRLPQGWPLHCGGSRHVCTYFKRCVHACIIHRTDPIDAARSFYHFLEHWFFDEGTVRIDMMHSTRYVHLILSQVTMEQFVQEFVLQRGEPRTPMQNASFWHNIASWYPHRCVGQSAHRYTTIHGFQERCQRVVAAL